jgi:alpha-galactosidase
MADRVVGWMLAAAMGLAGLGLSACSAGSANTSGASAVKHYAPGVAPRINGATVFGVRPGNPFLFTVPAIGDEPIAFSAENLPAGLSLDSATGRITGVLADAGEHVVTLHAENKAGEASEQFKIVVGETIALTPPMGWNSWNCWAEAVDQEKVLASAKAMVDKGLVKHGWTYINIDDTWQGKRGGEFNAIQANEKFPDMKGLCDQIHAMGLKIGIYSTPWKTSYAHHIGGSADNPEGTWVAPARAGNNFTPGPSSWSIGKNSFASNDAKQWAAWGFDYIKYDWNPNKLPETKEMADALRATNRDIVYSLSNSTPFANIPDLAPLANCWRTTGDIRDTWSSLVGNGFSQERWAKYASPGHWNDPDMLVVGYVGWGPRLHPSALTPDEQYTHISLWCLLSSPLLIGCDMTRLDEFTLGLLTNDDVLAVDQDPSGHEATIVAKSDDTVSIARGGSRPSAHTFPRTQVWAKTFADDSEAVGLFNLGDAAGPVTVKWSDLKISGEQKVRDLWQRKDLPTATDAFTATVPAHGVVLVKIWSK